MKRFLVIGCVLTVMLGISVSTLAVGLISIPTADLNPGKALIRGEIVFDSTRTIEGVFNINPKLEVGGMVVLDEKDRAELGISVKTLLAEETATEPAISAGIRMQEMYFVLSKSLGYGFRAHLGLGNGSLRGFFLGFSKVLNPVSIQPSSQRSLPAVALMGEYVAEQINLGARFYLQDNFKLDAALVNFNSLKLGLGYSF